MKFVALRSANESLASTSVTALQTWQTQEEKSYIWNNTLSFAVVPEGKKQKQNLDREQQAFADTL